MAQTGQERSASGRNIDGNFYFEIQKGDVLGHSHIDKFGAAAAFDVNHQVPLGPYVGPCDIGFFARVSSGTADVSVLMEIVLVKNE